MNFKFFLTVKLILNHSANFDFIARHEEAFI